ncbi:3260_t:CDS:2, partial [Funneliformis geosporum]
MTKIILHDYQQKAAEELTKQYPIYRLNPYLDKKGQPIPFLKFLSSVTGSGKTAILAQQTLRNLKEKYQSLISEAQVQSFLNISATEIVQLTIPLIYIDTVQKFSVQNKETRQIYQAHNLTDNQVEKILELSPQGIILASGTPALPHRLTDIEKELESNQFNPLYTVPFSQVKEKQMVKGKVVLGGYNSQMEEVLNEMLDTDWKKLSELAEQENLPPPKIIYVLKQKGIDPKTIAIYADVAVAKEEKYDLDVEFKKNLFNKGKSSPKENNYEKFITYIDKTIGSEVAVEQIIGRVLRQPNCRYYRNEELNKAYFHIRLDENKVFKKIIEDLNEKLAIPTEEIEIRGKTGGLPYLTSLPAKPDKIVNSIPNYEKEKKLSFRQNTGQVQRTEYPLGDSSLVQPEIREEAFGLANMVPAQVILRRAIVEKNTRLVQTYLQESLLRVSLEKPYEVKGIKVEKNEKRCESFTNALHKKYSGLNNLEKRTAMVLDSCGVDWCHTVICLEVTGEHLEKDKLVRKLVRIAEPGEELIEETPRQVVVIIIVQYGGVKDGTEIYYKVWYRKRKDGEVKSIRVESIGEGLR